MAKLMAKEIASFPKGQPVKTEFQLTDIKGGVAKNGRDYVAFKLSDKSGTIPAKMWETNISAFTFKDGDICTISGVSDPWNNQPQLVVKEITPRVSTTDDEFIAISRYPIEEMWIKLVNFVGTLESSHLRVVAEDILLNAGLSDSFKNSPAATGMHHAFVGGLLEHTWQMAEISDYLLRLPFMKEVLNRDLCLFGVMFHDFGKIFEYNQTGGFKKTVQGVLVPHIPMTAAMVYESANKYGIPEIIRDHMMHVILSHHKLQEHGSPVIFACPEAAFVHYVDNMHGDVFGFTQRIENDGAGKEYVKHGYAANNLVVQRFNDILKSCEGAKDSSFI